MKKRQRIQLGRQAMTLETQAPPSKPLLTRGQVKGITAGAALTAVGFYTLSLSDPAGINWASRACPFLILGGYGIIAMALWNAP